MKKFFDIFSSKSKDISVLISADARRRRLLNIMCIFILTTMIIYGSYMFLLRFVAPWQLLDKYDSMMASSMATVSVCTILILYLNSNMRGSIPSVLFIAIIWVGIVISDPIEEIIYGRSLITLTLPIIIASILLRPPGGLVVALLTGIGMIYASFSHGLGLPNVAAVATLLMVSSLTALANSQTEEAVEHLQKANEALQEKEASLEFRVRERTTELRIANRKLVEEALERKRVENILKESESRFSTIFRNSPVGIGIIRLADDCFIDVNDAILRLSGYALEEIVGHSSSELGYWVEPEERHKVYAELRSHGFVRDFEVKLRGKSGDVSDYLLSFEIMDLNGEKHALGTLVDITQRKRVEQTLKESENRFSTIFRTSPVGVGMIRLDNNSFVDVNETFLRFSEYSRDEIIGHTGSELDLWIMPDERGKLFRELQINGRVSEFEAKFRRRSGTVGDYIVSLELVDLNGEKHLLGTLVDISQRKKLEETLEKANALLESRVEKRTFQLRQSRDKLRELTRQLVTAQEEERRRVALELHDNAGQALIALQFSLDTIYEEMPTSLRKIRQRIKKAISAAEQTISQIRALAYSLRPPLLDLMGFNNGVENLCEEFSDQTGIKVEYVGADLPDIKDEISISLYRFVQEALTNVVKHARASKALVSIDYKDGQIRASVQDDGQGFKINPKAKGLGLTGMQERMILLGGSLATKSVKGNGTLMIASVPLK